jgi:DNA mismatch endonuclease (patch repair protein)
LSVGRWTFSVRPDFVFPSLKLAVFVDGCFWHGCPRHATKPKNNAAFWRKKLAANQARDRLVTRVLRSRGWRVLRIWEHELTRRHEARCVRRIRRMFEPAAASRSVQGGSLR